MAENHILGRIQQTYDSLENWKSRNPILLRGEVARVRMEDNTVRTKTGDGTSAFNSLSWDDKNLYDSDTATPKMEDSNIVWGGKDIAGGFGPVDASLVSELGANRFAFLPASCIDIEYSNDGGISWIDMGLSDSAKISLFSGAYIRPTIKIGNATSDNPATADSKLRITLTQSGSNLYNQFRKFIMLVSTNGSEGCSVTIQHALNSDLETFIDIKTASLFGWTGYNVINLDPPLTSFGAGASQAGKLRFEFSITGQNSSYDGLQIINIYGFGGVGWVTPSNMAKTGHLYNWDASQNATFPAQIKASYFDGEAKKATKDSADQNIRTTYLKGISASGTTLTLTKGNGTTSTIQTQDTTYEPATEETDGLMTSEQVTQLNSAMPKSGGIFTGYVSFAGSAMFSGTSPVVCTSGLTVPVDPTEEYSAATKKYVDESILTSLNYVTPEMFGAVGDGTTNDTVAIQNALSQSKAVIFTRTYYCQDQLSVNLDGATLIGVNNAKLIFGSKNTAIVRCIYVASRHNVVISNLTIEAKTDSAADVSGFSNDPRTASSYSNRDGILVCDSENILISNCKLLNNNIGIKVSNNAIGDNKNITIENCEIKAFTPIYVSHTEHLVITDCSLYCLEGNCIYDHGIYGSSGSLHHEINNCHFYNSKAICLQYITSERIDQQDAIVVCNNCMFSECGTAFGCGSPNSIMLISNCIVENNTKTNNTGELYCSYGSMIKISNSYIKTINKLCYDGTYSELAKNGGIYIDNCFIEADYITNSYRCEVLSIQNSVLNLTGNRKQLMFYNDDVNRKFILKNNDITTNKASEVFDVRTSKCFANIQNNEIHSLVDVSFYFYGESESVFVIKNNIFSSNIASIAYKLVPTTNITDNIIL